MSVVRTMWTVLNILVYRYINSIRTVNSALRGVHIQESSDLIDERVISKMSKNKIIHLTVNFKLALSLG